MVETTTTLQAYFWQEEKKVRSRSEKSGSSVLALMKWKNVKMYRHLNGGGSVSSRNIAQLYNSKMSNNP